MTGLRNEDRINIHHPYLQEQQTRVKPMTCVIGMYCNNNKDAVIISDSRAMLEIDFSLDQKIFRIDDGVVYASSGYSGMSIELLRKIADSKRREPSAGTLDIMTLEMYQMYETYKLKTRMFQPEETLLSAVVGTFGKTEGNPELYCLDQSGWLEPYNRKFRAIGDGARYAQQILMHLYKPNISLRRAMQIGIHAIVQISLLDAAVDNNVQMAALENGEIRMWNIDDNGQFLEKNDEIEEMKKRINGIESKRATLFDLMLSEEDELKTKVTETLDEYRKRSTI